MSSSPAPRQKQEYVIQAVTRMARKLGPRMKLPTAQELSRQLGVTVTTLDRSLAKLEGRGVIRRKQGSGIYVADSLQKKTIGLVFGVNVFEPGISPIYSILLRHCEKRAASFEERFSTYLGSPALSGSQDALIHYDLEEALKNQRLDGLLLFAKASGKQEECLRQSGIPMSVLTAHIIGPGVVMHDNEQMIRDAAIALKAEGCQSIGFLGPIPDHREMFVRTMEKMEMPCEERWVICPDVNEKSYSTHQGLFERQSFGRKSATRLISQGRAALPDALISSDDMITRGACPVFESMGIRVGRDFKFATQSNKESMVLAEWSSELIQFEFDPQETIDAMFEALEKQMQGLDASAPTLIHARRHRTTSASTMLDSNIDQGSGPIK